MSDNLEKTRQRYEYERSLDLAALRVAVALAESGSFTVVAGTLGISQSKATRAVQDLEKAVGIQLVVRTSRRVKLTAAGDSLIAHARDVLGAVERMRRDLHEAAYGLASAVELGMMVSVGSSFIPAFLSEFSKAYPKITVRLREGISDALASAVEAGDLDLAVVLEPIREPHLVRRSLWREVYGALFHTSHPLATRCDPLPLRALGHEKILVTPGRPTSALVEEIGRRSGATPIVAALTDNPETICRLVSLGCGVGLLPKVSVHDHEVPNVRTVPLRSKFAQRHVIVVSRVPKGMSASARALQNELVSFAERHRAAWALAPT